MMVYLVCMGASSGCYGAYGTIPDYLVWWTAHDYWEDAWVVEGKFFTVPAYIFLCYMSLACLACGSPEITLGVSRLFSRT